MLTLTFFALFPLHALSAGADTNTHFVSNVLHFDGADQTADQDNRVQSLVDFAKQEAPHLLPGLPGFLREPEKWALGTLNGAENFFDFGFSTGVEEEAGAMISVLRPVADMLHPAAPEDGQATWIAPTYHHLHGILPTRDAMIMGIHSRQDLFDHYMRLDIHPYYGQNYFSTKGYYGGEMVLDLASPADTSRTTKPWGKIVVAYTNGDGDLMDHGRGVDLHGELRFSDNLTLNSGMRQSDTTGSGNYVLLQWKMATE